MPYPNFLGIGAMKAGTSWLDHNLRQHPHIWMPPMKELRYFTKGMLGSKPKSNIRRITKLVQPSFRSMLLRHPLWMAHYLCARKTDEWYASLFHPHDDQICGEISPDYAKLDVETAQHIHNFIPDLKIIFFLRNPIDRAWSHILWDFCGGDGRHNLGSLDIDACIAHAESASSRVRGMYTKTIETWESVFPKDQIFIGFFEEIAERPEDLLRRIEQFLGVSEFMPEDIKKKVNVTPGPVMPGALREHLEGIYHDELHTLSTSLGKHATKWLNNIM